jgi:predicted HD phosphohydrolase
MIASSANRNTIFVFETTSELMHHVDSLFRRWEKSATSSDVSIVRQSCWMAGQAVAVNSSSSLIVASLFLHPCIALSGHQESPGAWSQDRLLESGTLDWLLYHFGEKVAGPIQSLTLARRYLCTSIPNYFQSLDVQLQRSVYGEGGFLRDQESTYFLRHRYRLDALSLLEWSDEPLPRSNEDIPSLDHFLPHVELVASENRQRVHRD